MEMMDGASGHSSACGRASHQEISPHLVDEEPDRDHVLSRKMSLTLSSNISDRQEQASLLLPAFKSLLPAEQELTLEQGSSREQ